MTRDACRRLRHFPPRANWDRFRRRIDPTSVNGWSLGGEPTRRVVPLLILTASTLIEVLIATRVAALCTVSPSTSASESTLRRSVPLRLSGGVFVLSGPTTHVCAAGTETGLGTSTAPDGDEYA